MRAARLTALGNIKISDEPIPDIQSPYDVQIQIKAAGICGTDLHIFKEGRSDLVLPRVLGHELAGKVTKIGSSVTRVKVGDHVIVDPAIGCGHCRACRKGHPNVCPEAQCIGVHRDGGFQDYMVIREDNVYSFHPDIPYETAALAEPFSVASNIMERADVHAGDRVLILGSGTIAVVTLIAAKIKGAKVAITVRNESKREIAQRAGADIILDVSHPDIPWKDLVREQEPEGYDVVVDAIGSPAVMRDAADAAASLGRIVNLGFAPANVNITLKEITMRGLTIVGSRMNARRFPEVVQWLNDGKIPADLLISRRYSINDIQRAFMDTQANHGILKTMLIF